MKQVLVAAVLLIAAVCAKNAPTWPDQYYVKGTFSIPYFEIVEPIEIYYDAVNNREALSYYDAMDTYIWRFDIQTLYQVIPRIDKMKCFTTTQIGTGPMVTLLPNITSWMYMGLRWKNRQNCDVWETTVTRLNKTAVYSMYINAQTQVPVELMLNGYDFVFGSHPDIYIMSYTEYKPNFVDASVFAEPALCQNAEEASTTSVLRAKALMGKIGAVIPPAEEEWDHFDQFTNKFNKYYSDKGEYEYRRAIFYKNKAYIEEHNAKAEATFQLAMNHLGDMTQEEISALITPKRTIPANLGAGSSGYHVSSGASLPASINWIDLGAVTPVKDQGVCGSCWTFGTTGALEGAYFVKTGQLVSLSEQQIVDCAWGPWIQGNSGCDGGFAGPAFEWIMQNGGIALENTYKYLMQDHWCNQYDLSSGVQVTGYVNVTSGSEDDLQDAVATVGPVTVAIDASHPSLTYYTSGVYYEPTCGNNIDDLDHQVLVVGYGTENGQDYWLVKNSWSTHWGDHGYVKMSRNRGNNCGIATAAQYPTV